MDCFRKFAAQRRWCAGCLLFERDRKGEEQRRCGEAPPDISGPPRGLRRSAFTLVEVLFAMAIIGIVIVTMYAAIANSASWVRICQENETVTQILSEKLDTIRLYNWDQINSNGFLLTNFTVAIDPNQTNSASYYTGRVTIVQAPIVEPYRTNLYQVTVDVRWVSGSRPQNRSMSSFITQYGLSYPRP